MPLRRIKDFNPEDTGIRTKKARTGNEVVLPEIHTPFKLNAGGACIVAEFDDQRHVIKGENFDPATHKHSPVDTRSYFKGALKVHHAGNGVEKQFGGAPLPAKPVQQPVLQASPYKNLVWDQPDIVGKKMGQIGDRRQEKSIMGDTANNVIQSAGIRPRPKSPWAHTRPDHINFDGREDPKLRVPGYVGANQVHSAFEAAAKQLAHDNGTIEVNRRVNEEIPGGSKLPVSMTLGFTLKNEQRDLAARIEHDQPYFTSAGARNGDEKAIVMFVKHHQELLDKGEIKANKYMQVATIDEMLESRTNDSALHTPDVAREYAKMVQLRQSSYATPPTETSTVRSDFDTDLDDRSAASDRATRG
ncbi:MAG: hypothetical protein AAFY99_15080 [Pseudomonadota bacterium]